jgi:asparagine synthase (glutamine-hydrolysing)
MCGITGILNLNGSSGVSRETLARMTAVLRHRGPDESGLYLDDQVGLGHARLSIIDLSTGQQPMHSDDETVWIIFNGEIFNYIELKADLEKQGVSFQTTSDTEVLLKLYQREGPACLPKLNGQFAFAIWDRTRRELFLARDRMGIRPIHYTTHNGRFIFSSEIKSIFMAGGVPREIDPVAMEQIFTFWTTLPGRTAFKDIHELPPGHYLKVAGGRVTIDKYWDIPLHSPDEFVNFEPPEICERIQELLLEAIRLRLRADVPVGTYLSGGLDSSGVTALVVRNFNNRVNTFGVRFQEAAFDEGVYQNSMVSFLNVRHQELQASNDRIGEVFPEVVWYCEKPILRTAPGPLYLLSGLVRQNNFKVVLTGEGADEVFGGYNIFREAKLRRFWAKQPDSKARPELIGRLYPYIFNNPRGKKTLQAFFARGLDRPDDPLFSHLIRWANTGKIKTFFSDELKAEIGGYDGVGELRSLLPPAYHDWDVVAKAQYLEMVLFLSNYLLSSQGDRVAMGHSLEIRLPYLDPKVMEFMGRVPSKWKIFGLDEKYILKRSFRGILPDTITARAKHPYRAPISESLLKGSFAGRTRELLSESGLKRSGLFDPGRVGKLVKLLEGPGGGSEVNNMALVGILSTQLVHQQYVREFPAEPVHPGSPDRVFDRSGDTIS